MNRKKVLIYWIAAIAVGGCIEFLQYWMALGRSGDFLDALANTAGALTGMVFSRVIHRVMA